MISMAMRSQVYEWANVTDLSTTISQVRRAGVASPYGQAVASGKSYSIFIGGIGNNITMPAQTTATQFVVIEDVASSPGAGMALQVRINTTDYFQNPDVTDSVGIPGLASPYPRGAMVPIYVNTSMIQVPGQEDYSTLSPSFNLYPDVYVLPGQTWDVLFQLRDAPIAKGSTTATGTAAAAIAAFVKYTLYDGPDALIANKLLEMGVSVNPNNVDWYKRTLIEQQSAAASAAVAAAAQEGGA